MLRVLQSLEPLLRRLSVGKPPSGAGNFTRGEQLWFSFNRWVATRPWMPKSFVVRATLALQYFVIAISNRAIFGMAVQKFGLRPATPEELKGSSATPAEARAVMRILSDGMPPPQK